MRNPIEKKVSPWDFRDALDIITRKPLVNYPSINLQIQFLEKWLFNDYEPCKEPSPEFITRLVQWLDNLKENEEDQKKLFRLIPRLFFVGRQEFDTLYRAAFNGPIARWLIDQNGIYLDDPAANTTLHRAAKSAWFCPITDSMRINGFYHVNKISGRDYRPDWRSLAKFGSRAKICGYIRSEGIRSIVLIEDFVGSGSQMMKAVEFAANLPGNIPVLILPLIVCPGGAECGASVAKKYRTHVSFSSVITLRKNVFVNVTPNDGEDELFPAIRDLVERTYERVSGRKWPPDDYFKPYGPFGFSDTGGLFVSYSNCPDNTLPIVHHSSATWHPLFPRATRIP
jgi:hypothetical protein